MTDKEKEIQEIEEGTEAEEVQEEIIAEEINGGETDAEETIAAAETDQVEEPKKKGKIRGFFKTRKLAIGITVLVVLLVANVAVLGANKMSHKGHRDHGGKTVEREYKQGQKYERGDKESGIEQDSEKIPRGDKECKPDKAPRGDGSTGKDKSKGEKDTPPEA